MIINGISILCSEHGAKGLCQERAFVSGLEAANQLLRSGTLKSLNALTLHEVIPIRDDELQVQFGRRLNRNIQNLLPPFLKLDSLMIR